LIKRIPHDFTDSPRIIRTNSILYKYLMWFPDVSDIQQYARLPDFFPSKFISNGPIRYCITWPSLWQIIDTVKNVKLLTLITEARITV